MAVKGTSLAQDVRALLDALDRQASPCSLNVRDARAVLRDRFPKQVAEADKVKAA